MSARGLGCRAAVVLCSAMVSTPVAVSESTALFWVDLEAAVQRVADGAHARRTLVDRQLAVQKTIEAREARLAKRRARMAPADFSAALEKHHARVEVERKRLEQMQDRLLRPILERLRARIRGVNEGDAQRRVLALQDGLLIGPPAGCDRTSWLVNAYLDPDLDLPDETGTCVVRRVLTVDVDRVMANLPESRAATARLQAFMEARQTDLDRRRRQQEEIAEKAAFTGDPRWKEELVHFSADLDRRYARYRAALREREAVEEDQLYAAIADRLARAARASLSWLAETRVDASVEQCDATAWAVEMVQERAARSPVCAPIPGTEP